MGSVTRKARRNAAGSVSTPRMTQICPGSSSRQKVYASVPQAIATAVRAWMSLGRSRLRMNASVVTK